MRAILYPALGAVLSVAPGATTVACPDTPCTSTAYSSDSTTEKIRETCFDVSLTTPKLLAAVCNDPDNDDGTADQIRNTTIDLSLYVGYGDPGRLRFGGTDYQDDCTNESLILSNTGDDYFLHASCGGNLRSLRLGERIYRLKNGTLAYSATYLGW